MKLGDHISCPAASLASGSMVIWGKRNAPAECPGCASRPCGPPASRRQYQRAKTRMFEVQMDVAENRSALGDSRCDGRASTSRMTDTIISMVTKDVTA